jgi:hypothetical protein
MPGSVSIKRRMVTGVLARPPFTAGGRRFDTSLDLSVSYAPIETKEDRMKIRITYCGE